jgi:hypothetical protein
VSKSMGIRFSCPNGHRLNVKEFLAGKRGICPQCGARFVIPLNDQTAPAMTSFAGAAENIDVLNSSEPGAQSVIIAVADSPSAQSIEPPPVTLQPVDQSQETSSVGGARPIIVTSAPNPSRPATGYELRRQRNRRNQITLAIVLLVAVAILAVVLLVVLQSGAQQPAAPSEKNAKASSPAGIPQPVSVSRVT